MSEQTLEQQNKLLKEKLSKLRADLRTAKATVENQKSLIAEKSANLLALGQTLDATEAALKEASSTPASSISKEQADELLLLSVFLHSCYKESEHVGVRTNLQKWRQLINDLTS